MKADSRCFFDCTEMKKILPTLMGKRVVIFTPDLNKTFGTLVKVHENVIKLHDVMVFRFQGTQPVILRQSALPLLWIDQIGLGEEPFLRSENDGREKQ